MTRLSDDQKLKDYLERFHNKHPPKPRCCQICQQSGHLRWHGRYERTLITSTQTAILPIRRLFCALCRHTFAWLPDFIAKFHRYAKSLIQEALRALRSSTYEEVASLLMDQAHRYVATLTLYFWEQKFA